MTAETSDSVRPLTAAGERLLDSLRDEPTLLLDEAERWVRAIEDEARAGSLDAATLDDLAAMLSVECDCSEAWTGRHRHAPDCRYDWVRDYLDDEQIAHIAALREAQP